MASAPDSIALLELIFSTLKFNQQVLFDLKIESFAAKDVFDSLGPQAANAYNEAKSKYQKQLAGQTTEMLKQMDNVLALLAKAKQAS